MWLLSFLWMLPLLLLLRHTRLQPALFKCSLKTKDLRQCSEWNGKCLWLSCYLLYIFSFNCLFLFLFFNLFKKPPSNFHLNYKDFILFKLGSETLLLLFLLGRSGMMMHDCWVVKSCWARWSSWQIWYLIIWFDNIMHS